MRLAAALLLLTASAVAADDAGLAKCRAITDSLARLSCYDKLPGGEAKTPPATNHPGLSQTIPSALIAKAKTYGEGTGEIIDVVSDVGCDMVLITSPVERVARVVRMAKKELRQASQQEIETAARPFVNVDYVRAAPYFRRSTGWECKGSEAPTRIFIFGDADAQIDPIAPAVVREEETTYGTGAKATTHHAAAVFEIEKVPLVPGRDLRIAVVFRGESKVYTIKGKALADLTEDWFAYR